MLVKSLLFIIVCIFVMETFNNLYRQSEEYFAIPPQQQPQQSQQITPQTTPPTQQELLDIDKTINANCTKWKARKEKDTYPLMKHKPEPESDLDTPYYSRFAPMEYRKDRKYYSNPHYLIEEGKRRYSDEAAIIQQIQDKYDAETDPKKKEELAAELAIFKWQKYIFNSKDDKGTQRGMPDITTDYFPEEIGLSRPWRERHSHLPDYKRMEVKDTKYIDNVKKYEKINPCSLWLTV